jgi:DNA-binding response OmpR family regulator
MKKYKKKSLGKIIIADDEQTFLMATAQLLRNEGFECDCVQDADEALKKITDNQYDLIIADIKMQGNVNLELVKNLSQIQNQISIILVTGYPSQQTATESVSLPVSAYLTKPVDFAELLQKTKAAVKVNQLYKTIAATRHNLKIWVEQLQIIELTIQGGKCNCFDEALKSFLEITTMKIDDTFNSIRRAIDLLDGMDSQTQICKVMKCPKLDDLTNGLEQTVASLTNSRELYKSKQLATIRVKLEKLLHNIHKI